MAHPSYKSLLIGCYYRNEHINKNLWFELQLALLSELLFRKINQHLVTKQIWEFHTTVVRDGNQSRGVKCNVFIDVNQGPLEWREMRHPDLTLNLIGVIIAGTFSGKGTFVLIKVFYYITETCTLLCLWETERARGNNCVTITQTTALWGDLPNDRHGKSIHSRVLLVAL